MPPDILDRVFEPFFTTKAIGKGSGLGLPQVLGVAKQLGGGVSIQSTPNQGTCITIFLPRGADASRFDQANPASGRAATVPVKQSARILLVDDDPDVRAVAAALLEVAGYQVVEAASGAAALEHLSRTGSQVELMVVDIAMPGINGVELAKIVRHTAPMLPIIFMTGYADADHLPADTGDKVLRKPFAPGELEAKVTQALGHSLGRPDPDDRPDSD